MKNALLKSSLLIFVLTFSACTSTRHIQDGLPASPRAKLVSEIDSLLNDSAFAHAFWGVRVMSTKTGEVWYERNADKMFMPASNEKIITGAVALNQLGGDFRYKTTVSANGAVQNGVLKGDLIVASNGDPSLYKRFYTDSREVFRRWAEQLKTQGITRITGRIVGDDNAFEDYPYGNGWPFDDFEYDYSAEIGALQLNENYVDLLITPPKTVGEAYQIQPSTPSNYYTVQNNLNVVPTGSSAVSASRPYGQTKITLKGQVVAGGKALEESPTMPNPTLFYATVLRETLIAAGIQVDGEAADVDDLPQYNTQQATVLIEHQSPPFSQLLKVMMKISQNLYAETFTRTLGWAQNGIGSFENGHNIVENQLLTWGIPKKSYVYADGSGLSRYNYTNPRILTTILARMRVHQDWEIWKAAFPIAGVDGTIGNRMKGTPAENNARAKTGTIANTRGLSGYVTTRSGEELVFSILVNGHLLASRDTDRITDGIVSRLAAW